MKIKLKKIFFGFASCFFIALLLLPFADEKLNLTEKKENEELRVLATKPEFNKDSLSQFTKAYERYYSDNFGFRNYLVELGSKLKYKLFNSSPTPDKVACGKDGWLFLSGRFYEISQDLSRQNLYKKEGLEAAVKIWEGRKKELADKNVKYYKAFWPDKHYIYSEYMPFAMQFIKNDIPARSDQAINYLKEKGSSVQILDVRAELLSEKRKNILYFKGDSHWNEYGAFIAYTQLMNLLAKDFPVLKPFPLSDYNIKWEEYERQGDLSTITKVIVLDKEPHFSLKKPIPVALKDDTEGYPIKTLIFHNDSAKSRLTALIYRDSFTTAMIPFITRDFKEVVLIWDTDYSLEMVDKVKPDLVIECYASRYFR